MSSKGTAILLLLAVALVGCIVETAPTPTSPGRTTAATQEPEEVTVDEAVALVCASPAYVECAEDMAILFEGLSPLESLPGREIFGVCAFESGGGAVVFIDSEAEADSECDALEPSDVVRVVELP